MKIQWKQTPYMSMFCFVADALLRGRAVAVGAGGAGGDGGRRFFPYRGRRTPRLSPDPGKLFRHLPFHSLKISITM